MTKLTKGTLLLGIASLVLGSAASAQLTDAEFKCQTAVSKAGSKFIGSKSKCGIKCQQSAAKGNNPIDDCYAPYGGTTSACVNDPAKGAEAKFVLAIRKACDPTFKSGTDCPECYAGGDCSDGGEAGNRMQNLENQVDNFGPGVFCLGHGVGASHLPTKEELTCETNTAKVLSKLVKSVNKCYDKCNANMRKSLIPPGSCNGGAVTDPTGATQACITAADNKSIAGVNKKCSDIGPVAVPDCNNDTVDDYSNGAAWTNLVEIAISGTVPGTYCAD